MLTTIVIIWILYKLEAPSWAYILMVISLALSITQFGLQLYNKGKENGKK